MSSVNTCLRHSSISYIMITFQNMPYKRSRWSINSPEGASYIKARVENDINAQFSYNFIVTNDDALKAKPPILVCDRCTIVYSQEDKYCSSCSYPLTTQAYEEIK